MNKNKTTSSTKLGGRDFINLGIFTVIFIVLFMACIMVMSMTIYTLPFGVALGSFVAASVYMVQLYCSEFCLDWLCSLWAVVGQFL